MATYQGKPTCICGAAWLPAFEAKLAEYGIKVRFTQLIGGYGPSAGTHADGLCFDLVVTDPGPRSVDAAYELVVLTARQMGADGTWERPYNWDGRGGIRHVHGLGNGCPHLAAAAILQQIAVRNRKNGLANGGPDTGPRPLSGLTWQQGIQKHGPTSTPSGVSDMNAEEWRQFQVLAGKVNDLHSALGAANGVKNPGALWSDTKESRKAIGYIQTGVEDIKKEIAGLRDDVRDVRLHNGSANAGKLRDEGQLPNSSTNSAKLDRLEAAVSKIEGQLTKLAKGA